MRNTTTPNDDCQERSLETLHEELRRNRGGEAAISTRTAGIVVVVGIVVLANGCTYEAGSADPDDEHAVFVEWDADSDERLSEREWRDGTFDLWDANDDGTLDRQEWTANVDVWFDDPDTPDPFGDWDVDADGYLDDEEWAKAMDQWGDFDDWDDDDDGWIDADEFEASFEWQR